MAETMAMSWVPVSQMDALLGLNDFVGREVSVLVSCVGATAIFPLLDLSGVLEHREDQGALDRGIVLAPCYLVGSARLELGHVGSPCAFAISGPGQRAGVQIERGDVAITICLIGGA